MFDFLITFAPTHYDLSLTLHGAARQFNGRVTVIGELAETADHIGLHAKDLTITSVHADDHPADFAPGPDDELRISQQDLAPGDHTIVIEFSGTITDAMHGLYPATTSITAPRKNCLLRSSNHIMHAKSFHVLMNQPQKQRLT